MQGQNYPTQMPNESGGGYPPRYGQASPDSAFPKDKRYYDNFHKFEPEQKKMFAYHAGQNLN